MAMSVCVVYPATGRGSSDAKTRMRGGFAPLHGWLPAARSAAAAPSAQPTHSAGRVRDVAQTANADARCVRSRAGAYQCIICARVLNFRSILTVCADVLASGGVLRGQKSVVCSHLLPGAGRLSARRRRARGVRARCVVCHF